MRTLVFTTTDTTTADTLLAEMAAGKVELHTQRDNGTFRKVHFLAEGTEAREHAEWVAAEREAGRTMKAIATEIHASVPSVRRMLNDLALTEEFEKMDAEELDELLRGGTEVEINMVVTEGDAE